MANTEDILYQAHNEGIWKEVLNVSRSLSKQDKYSKMEVGDRLEIAYMQVKEKKNGKVRKRSK